MRKSARASLAALAVVAAGAVTTAPALAAGPTTVKVTLKEFKVLPAPKSVKAGKVTFQVTNAGMITHEMVVVKTNLAPAKLKKADGLADETNAVGEVPELAKGKTNSVTLDLKPGKYVLLCNVPGHFAAGQWSAFTVR